MAKITKQPRSLFPTLQTIMLSKEPSFVEDAWAALKQDIPDLERIIEEESEKPDPHPDYLKLHEKHLRDVQTKRFAPLSEENSRRMDFFRAHLPPPHPYRKRADSSDRVPDLFSITQAEFQQAIASPNAEDRAINWIADLAYSYLNANSTISFSDPVISSRLEAVFDKIPETSFPKVAERAQGRNRINVSHDEVYTALGQRTEPWAQKLHTLYFDHWKPSWAPMSEVVSHAKITKKTKTQYDEIPLPDHGATVMLLDARTALMDILQAEKPPTGEWLDRPEVWSSVRSTTLQSSFFQACRKQGAFSPEGANSKPAPLNEKENKLLAGLQFDQAAATASTNAQHARAALHGYVDSISTTQDLSEIISSFWHLESEIGNDHELNVRIEQTAKRLSFSAQDALDLIQQDFPDRNKIDPRLDLLNQGRWTIQEMDALLTERPLVAKGNGILKIFNSVLKHHPGAWDTLSDRAISKLIQSALRHPNELGWNKDDTQLDFLDARLRDLDEGEKVFLAAHLASPNEQMRAPARIRKQLLNTLISSVPADELRGFTERVKNAYPGNQIYSDLLPFLKTPWAQEEAAKEMNQRARGKEGFMVGDRSADTLSQILGYAEGFSPSGAISAFDAKVLRIAFADLVKHIQRHEERVPFGYSDYRGKEGVATINLYKNMAFDLNAQLEQVFTEPVKVSHFSPLVSRGVLKEGDRITWDGFAYLVAPFLDEPRPALDSTGNDATTPSSSGATLDKDAIKQTLSSKPPQGPGHHGSNAMDNMMDMMEDMTKMGMHHPMMMHPHLIHPMMMNPKMMQPRHRESLGGILIDQFRSSDIFETPAPKAVAEVSISAPKP